MAWVRLFSFFDVHIKKLFFSDVSLIEHLIWTLKLLSSRRRLPGASSGLLKILEIPEVLAELMEVLPLLFGHILLCLVYTQHGLHILFKELLLFLLLLQLLLIYLQLVQNKLLFLFIWPAYKCFVSTGEDDWVWKQVWIVNELNFCFFVLLGRKFELFKVFPHALNGVGTQLILGADLASYLIVVVFWQKVLVIELVA